MGTKLYVGNLNYNTTEESLRALFGSERRDHSGVSARHLEQVLQQVAHLEVVASEAPVIP